MKLFTAICAALSAIACFIYAAQAQWDLLVWSALTTTFQLLYLAELWQQSKEP